MSEIVSHTTIAVFGASRATPGDGKYEAGIACGHLLATAGYTVVTGGYGGIMEAVSKGARTAGGHVVGVTAPTVFADRDGANEFVTEERPTAHLVERIQEMTDLSSGAIVLPGSLGTMTELGVVWNLAFVARFAANTPKPIVTVGPTWREIVRYLGSQLETDAALVSTAVDVDEAVDVIKRSVPAG